MITTLVDGTLEGTEISFRVEVSEPVSPDEIRKIAKLLNAVADDLASRVRSSE